MKRILLLPIIIIGIQLANCQSPQDWKISGITTVKGTISNFNKYYTDHNKIEIIINDWTNAYRRNYFVPIDEKGNFSLSFYIFGTQDIYIKYRNKWPSVVVSPNDTLHLIIDADSFPNKIIYSGKTSKICNSLDQYFNNDNYLFDLSDSKKNHDFQRSLSFDDYKNWKDSIFRIEQKRVENYIKENKPDNFISAWLRDRCKLLYQSDLLSFVPEISSKYLGSKPDTITNVLLRIINSSRIDTSEYLTINSGSYFSLINSLHMPLNSLAFYYKTFEKQKINVAPSQEKYPENKLTSDIYGTKEAQTKEGYPYFLKLAEHLINNKQIKESVIAHNYTMKLERQNIDLGLDSTLSHISSPDIRASIINEYNSYIRRKLDQNALKVKEESDTLLNYLRNKYQGYVLYVDFWSTFGRNNDPYFSSITEFKKHLRSQKIAFVFFCYDCDKTKWIKLSTDYKSVGEHIFLNTDQYSNLAYTFKLIGGSKHVIIDTNGQIVNENAPTISSVPVFQTILINELNKYLKK